MGGSKEHYRGTAMTGEDIRLDFSDDFSNPWNTVFGQAQGDEQVKKCGARTTPEYDDHI